jgi:hypothetical protein
MGTGWSARFCGQVLDQAGYMQAVGQGAGQLPVALVISGLHTFFPIKGIPEGCLILSGKYLVRQWKKDLVLLADVGTQPAHEMARFGDKGSHSLTPTGCDSLQRLRYSLELPGMLLMFRAQGEDLRPRGRSLGGVRLQQRIEVPFLLPAVVVAGKVCQEVDGFPRSQDIHRASHGGLVRQPFQTVQHLGNLAMLTLQGIGG